MTRGKAIFGVALCVVLYLCPSLAPAGLGVLDYNVEGIGQAGSEAREALQRIVDYFDPDVIILQEAKGTTYPQEFLSANPDYEGFYSSADGAWNRRMIMSKYNIIDDSVREYELGEGSLRTLFAATVDLPGPQDLEIFTAHWCASSASVREEESASSAGIVRGYRSSHPGAFYVYAGDFNDVDTCTRITDLLEPLVGLTLLTPADPNNGSIATINSDPATGTYLDRRIDYILPSDALVSYGVTGRVLNTWSYSPEAVPSPLQLSDTVAASDHLPVYGWFDLPLVPLPGDANRDGKVDYMDLGILATHYDLTNMTWGEADFTGDALVNYVDLGILATYYDTSGATWARCDFSGDRLVDYVDLGVLATWYDSATAGGVEPVPAPAALCLLAAGAAALLRRRRR